MPLLALGLGSNVGDRRHQIQVAVSELTNAFDTQFRQSSLYETEPWGVKDQPAFVNQVILGDVDLPIEKVFDTVLKTEVKLGKSKAGHWKARNIDIDCLFMEETVVDSKEWKLPHPELHNRNFVLIPLFELIPDWVHPVLGITVEEMYWNCEDTSEVSLIEAH